MANYNILVSSITKTSGGFSGTFEITDNDILVSMDGKTFSKASGTFRSSVETIVYDGTLRPKIADTQGRRKEDPARAEVKVGGEWKGCQVVWSQGHRGAVASAFMAVWGEVGGGLEVGKASEVNRSNPKGGRSGSSAAVAAVDTAMVQKLEAQAAEMAELKAMLAALVAGQAEKPAVKK